MMRYFLSDPALARKPAPLAGPLADLVARAQGRPIYCTAGSFAVRRAVIDVVIASLRRDCPGAVFLDALSLYRSLADWDRRWPSEHERYGAGIVVTRAESPPEGTDPFAGLAGEHAVSLRVGLEIETLVRQGRPVAWHAVVFPASYWLSRFAIEPFNPMSSRRYAGVAPDDGVESFRPTIGRSAFLGLPRA
jgi:hypothetical protein